MKIPAKLQAILDKVNVAKPIAGHYDNDFIRQHITRRFIEQTKLKIPLHKKLYFAEQSMLSANGDTAIKKTKKAA